MRNSFRKGFFRSTCQNLRNDFVSITKANRHIVVNANWVTIFGIRVVYVLLILLTYDDD